MINMLELNKPHMIINSASLLNKLTRPVYLVRNVKYIISHGFFYEIFKKSCGMCKMLPEQLKKMIPVISEKQKFAV